MPISFWEFVAGLARHSLSLLVKNVMKGDIDCSDWTNLFYHHVPGAWVLLLGGITQNERGSDVGLIQEKLKLNRSISVLSILCYMQNSQCTMTQIFMATLLSLGKRITHDAINTLNHLGVVCSQSSYKGHQIILRQQGKECSQEIINLAKQHNKVCCSVFDNIDFNAMKNGVHIIGSGIVFGDAVTDQELAQVERINLCDVTLKTFEKSVALTAATEAMDNARLNKCLVMNTALYQERVAAAVACPKELVVKHDNSNKVVTKRGRRAKKNEEEITPIPPTQSKRRSIEQQRMRTELLECGEAYNRTSIVTSYEVPAGDKDIRGDG
jgi:predicted transcriptional regulator